MKRLLHNGARSAHRPEPGEYRGCPNPKCHGVDLTTVKTQTRAGERLKVVCADCGRFVRFVPLPWTLERARRFILPYGKYRGRSVGDLTASVIGRDYLRWLAANTDGNVAKAAGIALEAISGEDPGP
jgi:hypothetical protein